MQKNLQFFCNMSEGWTIRNTTDYHLGAGQSVSELPLGIYKLVSHAITQELYLICIQDKFSMPDKVYDLDTLLIDHVQRYHEATRDTPTGNLGILLAGVKGSGKTITAKQLCNTLGLPVILITHAYAQLPSFINDIKQNVLFFVDEYEKVFAKPNESMLLTVMDGAMDNGWKRVFLLTINEIYISDNLLERPGRIRYFKRYTDMSLESIHLVLKDSLKRVELYKETLDFISKLQTITIDIVRSIVEEVNLCNASPFTFASIFNVKIRANATDLYEICEDKSRKLVQENFSCFKAVENQSFILASMYWRVTKVLTVNSFQAYDTSTGDKNATRTFEFVERVALHTAFVTAATPTATAKSGGGDRLKWETVENDAHRSYEADALALAVGYDPMEGYSEDHDSACCCADCVD